MKDIKISYALTIFILYRESLGQEKFIADLQTAAAANLQVNYIHRLKTSQ